MGWFKKIFKKVKKGVKNFGKWAKKKALPAIKKVATKALGAVPVVGGVLQTGVEMITGGSSKSKKPTSANAANVALASVAAKNDVQKAVQPTEQNPQATSSKKGLLFAGLGLGGLLLASGGELDF